MGHFDQAGRFAVHDAATTALDEVANGIASPGILYWVPLMQLADIETNIVRWKELFSR